MDECRQIGNNNCCFAAIPLNKNSNKKHLSIEVKAKMIDYHSSWVLDISIAQSELSNHISRFTQLNLTIYTSQNAFKLNAGAFIQIRSEPQFGEALKLPDSFKIKIYIYKHY